MLTLVIIIVVVAVVALLAYAASRPDTMHIERTAIINAPSERIFPFIDDFHKWAAWSPWEKLDPALKRTYSGAPAGRGAVYEWDGNRQAGKGRMEITDTSRPSRVTVKLDFIKPFEGHNVTQFTLVPEGSGTRVTWVMDGPSAFMAKVMGIFVNMDQMIGKDFDAGLATLKIAAEQSIQA